MRTSFFVGRDFRDLADLNAQAEAWCCEVRGANKHPEDRTLTVATALDELFLTRATRSSSSCSA